MIDSDEIIYKKSWVKHIFTLFVLIVFTMTFLLMGFSDEVSWSWIAWIIAAASGIFMYSHLKVIFGNYSLKINSEGIEFCGQLYAWDRINSIDHMVHSVSHVYLSTIYIPYDDETIKPLFYFINKKLVSPKLVIAQYKLNASQDEIYESLRGAYEKFGQRSK